MDPGRPAKVLGKEECLDTPGDWDKPDLGKIILKVISD
jgi:hypothetical protein